MERLRVVETAITAELEAANGGGHADRRSSRLGGIGGNPFKRGARGGNNICFHIGIPGPTKKKKLERISGICEVSSKFLVSVFDLVDQDHDGHVTESELQCVAMDALGISGAQVSELFTKHDAG